MSDALADVDPIAARALAAVTATGEPFDVVTIDPAFADTAAFCEHYGYGLDISANCLLVASRDEPPALAACLVLATTRLDVNRVVRKLMGVRKLSFAPAELTLERTGMQLGGVTRSASIRRSRCTSTRGSWRASASSSGAGAEA